MNATVPAGGDDFEVRCTMNANLNQVRVIVRNRGENRRTVAGVRLVRPLSDDAFIEILTHVLEDGNYDFQSTDLPKESYLSVVLQLGRVDGVEPPKVFGTGRQEIVTVDPGEVAIQATIGGDEPVLYTIEPSTTPMWAKNTDSAYWKQNHPEPTPPKTAWWLAALKSTLSWVSSGVGAAVTAGVTAGVVALGWLLWGWLGGGSNVTETATRFWEPPAIDDARWESEALTATCSATGALEGAASSCQEVVDDVPVATTSVVPCFAVTTSRYVCTSDPWTDDVVLAVTSSDPSSTDPPAVVVASTTVPASPKLDPASAWALELTDGRQCVLDFEHGADRYRCADSGTLFGPGDTTSLPGIVVPEEGAWTIQVRPDGGGSRTTAVKIKTAWGVYVAST